MGAQQDLSRFIADSASAAVPPDAKTIALVSLLDTLAVAVAGRSQSVVKKAVQYVSRFAASTGPVGWHDRRSYIPEAAALLNATAAHAIDYDDVTPAWRGHPGSVMWPALLASVHEADVGLDDLLEAYVIGFEVAAQLGANVISFHYPAGWHSTCTIGIFAAAAACARVRKLESKKVSDALSLAVAQSAGMQASFGFMTKPMQVGFASAGAVRAVELACLGVEAPCDALEGAHGFSGLYGQRNEISLNLPLAGSVEWAILHYGIEVKRFPSCYATHRAIVAAQHLFRDLKGYTDAVVGITIEGSTGSHDPLRRTVPISPDEARFSVEFGVACALVEGKASLRSFSEDTLNEPRIQRLMAATCVVESSALGPKRTARVSLRLLDGSTLAHTVQSFSGSVAAPTGMGWLALKIDDCLHEAGLTRSEWDIFSDFGLRLPPGIHKFADFLELLPAASEAPQHTQET